MVPNWNGAARLEKLLASLSQQTERASEVLVVDNASQDRSKQVADAAGAAWIPLDRNYGFARAVNTGIRKSTGEATAILNNDVTLAPDFLAVLGGELDRHAFAVPKILMADGTARIDGSFDLTSRGFCSWRAGHGFSESVTWNQQRNVASAPMTAALFRRSLFDEVGLLDEQFGSYLEDVDFGLRCALKGLFGSYKPAAVAWHEGSATLGGQWNTASVRWIARNQVLLARKYGSLVTWPVLAGQMLWGLSAIKHGAGWAWFQGKIEGCRVEVPTIATEQLTQILRSQEQEILTLLSGSGTSQSYWTAYFALTGGHR